MSLARTQHLPDTPLRLAIGVAFLILTPLAWIFLLTVRARSYESRELRKTASRLNASFLQSARLDLLRDMAENRGPGRV